VKVEPKVVAPIGILFGASALVAVMFACQEDIEPRPPEVTVPLIRTVVAEPESWQFGV
jgi:hypothetical protein